MSQLINFQYYVILGLSLASTIIAISNNFFLRRFISKTIEFDNNIFVSVLIPARNEEGKIYKCLEALVNQTYGNLEIIVLNDNSDDATPQIVTQFEKDHCKVKLINGIDLPLGWGGKNWACHQLANSANGEYILFLDSDTVFQSDTIEIALQESVNNNVDLLTLIPKRHPSSIVELLMFPFMNWAIFSWLPIKIAHRSKNSYLSATFGQFMLFKKEAYLHIGGHEKVHGNAIDDFQLGRFVKKSGLKWMLLDGTNMIESMPYDNSKEAFNGISRSIFPALNYSVSTLFILSLSLMWMIFIPLVTIFYGLFSSIGNSKYLLVATIALSGFLISWTLTCRRFQYPLRAIPMFPFSVLFMICLAFHSMVSVIRKTTVWKERKIHTEKMRF
jgi:chlorobactene glucosyltransferase